MNKIYRVFKNESLNAVAVGYLMNESDDKYTIRIQNGIKTDIKTFPKKNYYIKSIQDEDSGERYLLKIKDAHGNASTIELTKSCFGGCG